MNSKPLGIFGLVLPFTLRDGILVDATGVPVPPLPKVEQKGAGFVTTGSDYSQRTTKRKFNPGMITSDFDGRSEDE